MPSQANLPTNFKSSALYMAFPAPLMGAPNWQELHPLRCKARCKKYMSTEVERQERKRCTCIFHERLLTKQMSGQRRAVRSVPRRWQAHPLHCAGRDREPGAGQESKAEIFHSSGKEEASLSFIRATRDTPYVQIKAHCPLSHMGQKKGFTRLPRTLF